MEVSGNLGGIDLVVYKVFSSHEQENYPTNSLDENCMEFIMQTDCNRYVALKQTYVPLKLKFVKGRGNETYKTKEDKMEHREEAKAV